MKEKTFARKSSRRNAWKNSRAFYLFKQNNFLVETDQNTSIPKKNGYRERILASVNYNQACRFLQAIEINRRRSLSPRCVAYLANYVAHSWESNPEPSKICGLIRLMATLLDSTTFNAHHSLTDTLQLYCSRSSSMPTICPAVTLLVAVSYIQRLNQRYIELKGTTGCGSRLILVAYIIASKFIHDNLRSILYNSYISSSPLSRTSSLHATPVTDQMNSFMKYEGLISSLLPCSNDKIVRIMRMELEFLTFLNYDLTIDDPTHLVLWAQTFEEPEDFSDFSGDDGDDEMDDGDGDSRL
ncbi:hypothetical protein BDF14DRAFT_1775150 [Spinellus fusiger]|nr:hypothetical protein BDF14DRAFT_1775150 [Spinellus fusiger]